MHGTSHFLAGVIEGSYRQSWSQAERLELLDWMASWGLNTKLYAPNDDLQQRAAWRELYPTSEAEKLERLLDACHQRRPLASLSTPRLRRILPRELRQRRMYLYG